jgi:hypothetical protein
MSNATRDEGEENRTISVVRAILLTVLILGMLGTGTELLLIMHTEDFAQWVPLMLIVLSFFVLGWYGALGGSVSMRVFQATMIAFIVAGFVGFYFHYQGSVEFKLESNPSLKGWALFWEAMRGKAPPPLAPGIMVQLGLIGLVYTYRHPVLMHQQKGI